jgi:hypothetical protein
MVTTVLKVIKSKTLSCEGRMLTIGIGLCISFNFKLYYRASGI